MPRKIAIITGSRGEYGYIRPIIRLIEKDPDLSYELIVTNMHLLHDFGYSLAEIEKDGFKISETIYNTFDGYNHQTMVKSLGIFLMQLPEVFARIKPDMILVAGDRGEQLIAAMTGAHMCIPVAHIQAGEVSGNIDDSTRHAIARYSHIHFCANDDAAKRLISSGEQGFRIFKTGGSMLDELFDGSEVETAENIYKKFGIDPSNPVFLFVMHSVTEEFNKAMENAESVFEAVASFGAQTIIVLPNSDAGSRVVRDVIYKNSFPFIKIFRNMPRRDYAGLMSIASVIIGNSSSGLIEAPIFKLPAVNVGRRQMGRECAANVIHVDYSKENIIKAIKTALSPYFRESLQTIKSPYGDGQSSEKIINILKNIKIDDNLIMKRLTF